MEERNLILEAIEDWNNNIYEWIIDSPIIIKYNDLSKMSNDINNFNISDDDYFLNKINLIVIYNGIYTSKKNIEFNFKKIDTYIWSISFYNINMPNSYLFINNLNNNNININFTWIEVKKIILFNNKFNSLIINSKKINWIKKIWWIIIKDKCIINNINILNYESNYDQENISIYNSEIDKLIIEKSNFKDLVINNSIINNIKIKDNNILNFNLLNFHNNLYINNNICNCNFLLENSNLSEKNVKIFNLNIENFKIENSNLWKSIISNTKINNLELKNPVLNETIFNNVEFPKTDIKIAWEENSTNYSEVKEYYIQLKNVMDNSWNHIQADKFFAKEMEYYGKSLKWEKWQFWNKLVYYIQKWISDFWNDWTLPILWMINLWNFFLIIDYYLKDYKLISDVNLILYLKNLYRYLNDLANAIKPLDVLNVTSDITFFWLLYKITLAILIYHLIISLKRLTKR